MVDQELGNIFWRALLTGDMAEIPPEMHNHARTEMFRRRVLRALPSDPRCLDCGAPFHGVGSNLVGLFGINRSNLSPNLCTRCDTWIRKLQLGTEVELAMLFADIRGSINLAEELGNSQFAALIDRFYETSTNVLVDNFALIDKLAGDEVAGLFVPGIAGPGYSRRAIEAAEQLLSATGHNDIDGPWVPVGVGIHVGKAYVGAVGSKDGMADITALGDAVNTAARLASQAGPGEIIVSEEVYNAAELNSEEFEKRVLDLKGKSRKVHVRSKRARTKLDTFL